MSSISSEKGFRFICKRSTPVGERFFPARFKFQLTLEQHGLELCWSTYTHFFFFSINSYSTTELRAIESVDMELHALEGPLWNLSFRRFWHPLAGPGTNPSHRCQGTIVRCLGWEGLQMALFRSDLGLQSIPGRAYDGLKKNNNPSLIQRSTRSYIRTATLGKRILVSNVGNDRKSRLIQLDKYGWRPP